MIKPRLILCSGARKPRGNWKEHEIIQLDALGTQANVNIQLEDVSKTFLKLISPRLTDLIEIASYIYSTDTSTDRGTGWSAKKSVESWARDFKLVIPVRDFNFWDNDGIKNKLKSILQFLSDDHFEFIFTPLVKERTVQDYLQLNDADWPFSSVDRVLMFSGGLDSLAGAVEKASNKEKLVLVSHRSVTTLDKRQRDLFIKLKSLYSDVQMIHIPVWINKSSSLGKEYTQRTRSFLFASIGTVIADALKSTGIDFFENGVVSLNLPVADEVLRSRASRTTHPISLASMTELFKKVLERDFEIGNNYIFKTKKDIVDIIVNSGASELIQHSCSCAHSMFKTKNQWHCGTCSQCIDRRFAVLAANQEHNDPETDYVKDVFIGNRDAGYEKNMAINYVRHGIELNNLNENQIAIKFNMELSRSTRYFQNQRNAAEHFIEMHKRHGAIVNSVILNQLTIHSQEFINGELPKNSMLSLVAGQKHMESSWRHYSDRIYNALSLGIPSIVKSGQPKNEPHLQELCDGILKSNNLELIREYPFMRWASSLTKPDWSLEELNLWVELKYIRKKEDISVVLNAIATDITKYGDSGKRVLYVVYDPDHLVLDDRIFKEPLKNREEMLLYFLR